MDCRTALEFLTAGVDAPLDAASQRALDAHLVTCPACVEVLREHVLAREALREASLTPTPEPALPDATVTQIVASMRAARAAAGARGTKTA
ncbi:MAG: zf-HC2 domain-containing protein [Planctomycetota bacterium]